MIWKWLKKGVSKEATYTEDIDDLSTLHSGQHITLENIKKEFKDIDDFVIRELTIKGEQVNLCYMKTLIDFAVLKNTVFSDLSKLEQEKDKDPLTQLKHAEVMQKEEFAQCIFDLSTGYTIILFQSQGLILKVNTFSSDNRSITATETETTVLGPQDAYTESLDLNISLVRRRIRSPHLKTKILKMGTETNNTVAVLYMDNIAHPENVERVFSRLKHIEYEGFVGLGILKQMLEDKPYSPFPQFGITARPDNTAAALLDGRIIVMLNDSPDAAILPTSFLEFFNSPEDFYNRWTTASLLRFLRIASFVISILLTSTYVSVLTFHPDMLPQQLLELLAESRATVPFPPLVEVLLMELVIEILREAGARMPTKIGQTIGIVGGIVIGTAAVEAGLASNILIVLVAITALTSFVPPNYLMSNAIRFVRYAFILGAGIIGMYGQMAMTALLVAHLSNMTSLGTPYMSPIIPRQWSDLLNSILRAPIKYIVTRSKMSRSQKDLTRPLDEE